MSLRYAERFPGTRQLLPALQYLDRIVNYVISHLTRDQLRIFWHQHPCHLHNRRMKLVSRVATGVPDLATNEELHKCPICMATKLRKTVLAKVEMTS
jgi:hypothetical protein